MPVSFSRSWSQFKLRARRQYYLGRAIRRRAQVKPVRDRSDQIAPGDLLCFVTMRNERARLPYFLEYYRKMGIGHFLMVDNDSDDDSLEYISEQPDVSAFSCASSYKTSRFGMDWINWLLYRYGQGHWCLTVDPDEFFVFPHCDSRPMRALTDWLDASGTRSFAAMLLDMYPRDDISAEPYREGQNPFEIARWFDPANYTIHKNGHLGNLWIQGGPRGRSFFADAPAKAPALNKIPLVKWDRSYVYLSSTHMLLPRALNAVYDEWGGELASGCLLHAKFLDLFIDKSIEELTRGEHYANSQEYRAYADGLGKGGSFWTEHSRAYEDWRQLEDLGLISRGNWA